MGKRYVVLPLAAVQGVDLPTLELAEKAAGKKVDIDGRPHVIVEVVGEVRRRMVPNVEVVRFAEAANG